MDTPSVSNMPFSWPLAVQPVSGSQRAENSEIVTALKAVNKAEMFGQDQELTFVLDRSTQRAIIQLIDRNTGEVIRQIPADYVLQAAKELQLRKSPP